MACHFRSLVRPGDQMTSEVCNSMQVLHPTIAFLSTYCQPLCLLAAARLVDSSNSLSVFQLDVLSISRLEAIAIGYSFACLSQLCSAFSQVPARCLGHAPVALGKAMQAITDKSNAEYLVLGSAGLGIEPTFFLFEQGRWPSLVGWRPLLL